MTTTALTTTDSNTPATRDLLSHFGAFLRLHVADGDASPNTIRSYYSNARQFAEWCREQGIDPAKATEDDLLICRKYLNENYGRGTVGVKLAAIKRLYEAAVWRGLRSDNPAAGLKAPKDKTERSERIKFLPLEGLRRLLAAPKGDRPAAVRDRAMLAFMGRYGLPGSEVAGLAVDDLDLDAGTVRVLVRGNRERAVCLIDSTAAAIGEWLPVRLRVANEMPGQRWAIGWGEARPLKHRLGGRRQEGTIGITQGIELGIIR